MGYCSISLFSYGIIIPIPEVIALLNALRKIPSLPATKESTREDTEHEDTDELEDWEFEYIDELSSLIM